MVATAHQATEGRPTRYVAAVYRVALFTLSDRGAAGLREDTAAVAIRDVLASGPYGLVHYEILPDEQAVLRAKLRLWSEGDRCDLIVTCGGTGLSARDRTPEATMEVVERTVPGLAERMRAEGSKSTPLAALSRGVVGVRKDTMIVNLPGSTRGARESLESIVALLPHALDVIRGTPRGDPAAWHA